MRLCVIIRVTHDEHGKTDGHTCFIGGTSIDDMMLIAARVEQLADELRSNALEHGLGAVLEKLVERRMRMEEKAKAETPEAPAGEADGK